MPSYSYYKIKHLAPSEIGQMNKHELEGFVSDMRKKYGTRKVQFTKPGQKNLYSPAMEKMEDYYNDSPQKAPTKTSRQKLLEEAFRLQGFFQSKTATVKGAREVSKEQDARLFGTKIVKGKEVPKYRMSRQQRENFWNLYDEFLNQNKTALYRFGSNRIQQYLASMFERKSSFEITPERLNEIFDDLNGREKEENDGFTGSDVYSGKWYDK